MARLQGPVPPPPGSPVRGQGGEWRADVQVASPFQPYKCLMCKVAPSLHAGSSPCKCYLVGCGQLWWVMPNRCLVVFEQLPTAQWCLHSLPTIARFECSYHGWQFRGSDGRATVIPQADDEKSLATAVASRRSCCAVHPCAVSTPYHFVLLAKQNALPPPAYGTGHFSM